MEVKGSAIATIIQQSKIFKFDGYKYIYQKNDFVLRNLDIGYN